MLRFPSWQIDCRLRSSELPPSRGRTSRQDQGPGCLWRIGEGLEMLLRISVLFGSIALSSSSSVCETGFARKLKPCLHHPLSLTWDSYRPILSNFRDFEEAIIPEQLSGPENKTSCGQVAPVLNLRLSCVLAQRYSMASGKHQWGSINVLQMHFPMLDHPSNQSNRLSISLTTHGQSRSLASHDWALCIHALHWLSFS